MFSLIFILILELFGILLGGLRAPFGCFWPPLGVPLAPFGAYFGTSASHPEPFQRHGLTLGGFWSSFWVPLGAFGFLWGSSWVPLAPILDLQDAMPSLFTAMD